MYDNLAAVFLFTMYRCCHSQLRYGLLHTNKHIYGLLHTNRHIQHNIHIETAESDVRMHMTCIDSSLHTFPATHRPTYPPTSPTYVRTYTRTYVHKTYTHVAVNPKPHNLFLHKLVYGTLSI